MASSHYEKYGRAWYQRNRESELERSKLQKRREYKTKRDSILKNRYGIEEFDYKVLLDKQGGICAICGDPPKSEKAFDIDHCHSSKVIRGLLCNNCNRGLGHFKDKKSNLMKAIQYLERAADRAQCAPSPDMVVLAECNDNYCCK